MHKPKKGTKKKAFRFFKKKPVRGKTKSKSNRCFICGKKGHFSKECPQNSKKAVKIIQQIYQSTHLDLDDAYIESLFSEQDETDRETIFALEISEPKSTSSNDTDMDVCDVKFLNIHAASLCSSAQLATQIPLV